ncbi:hypothetical protein DL93DRAFT_2162975 [Clavulina sp. PMI_390]|nr:hypothetical protein DL93DRAFT_2162975 [Clavulina sp. PMI_390]
MSESTDPQRVWDPSVAQLQVPMQNAPMTSHYFPNSLSANTPIQASRILVPSSSPEPGSAPATYTPMMGHRPPTTARAPAPAPSLFAGRMMQDERLNTQYGYSSPSLASNGSASSSRSSSVRPRDEVDDGAPPRKKANLGLTAYGSSGPSSGVASSSNTRQSTPDSLYGMRQGVDAITVTEGFNGSPSPVKPRGKLVKGRQPTAGSPPQGGIPNLAARAPGSTFKNTTPLDHLIRTNPNIPTIDIQRHYAAQGGDANLTLAAMGRFPQHIPYPMGRGMPMYTPIPMTSYSNVVPYANQAPKLKGQPKPVVKKPAAGGDSEESDWDSGSEADEGAAQERVEQALKWFGDATEEQLVEVLTCTPAQAQSIISLRPFSDEDDIRKKLQRKKGVSPRYFDDYTRILAGFDSVDSVIAKCEKVGKELNEVLAIWASVANTPAEPTAETGASTPTEAAGVSIVAVDADAIKAKVEGAAENDTRAAALKDYMSVQPAMLAEGVLLKDYQLLGINWLSLLHRRKLSCILADEMGLGKTIQVIAFLCALKERGVKGPHLIVVPSSTLENWGREFEKFAPELVVQTYYGTQNERIYQRAELNKTVGEWDVCITTYNLAQGNEHDRKFFKKIEWECAVFDEGHVLKNFRSQRYDYLLRIPSEWRLMLTGTPLQNNLQELVSLMNFILPQYFKDVLESLRAIFKASANSSTSFLSESRVKRASKMMTPFVLRRRKDQVLKDLPKKTERVEWCELTPIQKSIYEEALLRSKKVLQDLPQDEKSLLEAVADAAPKKGRPKKALLVSSGANSSNILMDLRKASLHPMLFRRRFDDAKVNTMARHCLSETEFAESKYELVVEDMQVMNDAELQWFCKQYSSVKKHALDEKVFLEAGKITKLLALLEGYKKENKRVLIFSQFTQVLDILKVILEMQKIRYLVLTGQTAVSERQTLVDEFNEDEDIPVFLLSTRAGGMGINLTAACVVIIFDQDFNPHNDKQACDRAYRIGQKRDVEVVKLITRGTIEESMLRLAQVKLVLDQAVTSGEGNEEEETATEKSMKASLLSELRKQFEEDSNGASLSVAP